MTRIIGWVTLGFVVFVAPLVMDTTLIREWIAWGALTIAGAILAK